MAQNLPRQKIRLNITFKFDPQGTNPSRWWWRSTILKRSWGERRRSLFALSLNVFFHLHKNTSQTFSCQKILPCCLDQEGQIHLSRRDALSHFNCRQKASLKILRHHEDNQGRKWKKAQSGPEKCSLAQSFWSSYHSYSIKVQEWCEIFRLSCISC